MRLALRTANRLDNNVTVETTEMMTINFKREVNRLVGPILIETLLTFLLGGVDTFMLSQYSDAAVAAVGVDNQILQLVFLLFTIINAGTSVLCAQYLGAGREEKFIRVGIVALALNLVIGMVVSIALFLGAQPILTMMGLRPELMAYGRPYMQIVGAMAFAQAVSTTVSTILRSAKMPVPPMLVVGIVNILNIAGNYILIFGKCGMPSLGVEGAAISTSISRGVSMVLLLVILRWRLFTYVPRKLFAHFPTHELRNLLKIGMPSAGENISYNLQQLTLLYFINMMGNDELTARTYIVNVVMFVYLYAICIAQASSIMVGHLVGLGKTRAAFVVGRFSWRRGGVVSLSFSLLCALCGPFIAGCLTDNAAIISLVCTCFWVDVLLEVGKCVNIWATNTLRATGDILFPFYLGIIVQWGVGVVFGYLLGIVLGLGLVGMWFAFVLDENIRGLLFVRRWNSMKWANKSFVEA